MELLGFSTFFFDIKFILFIQCDLLEETLRLELKDLGSY